MIRCEIQQELDKVIAFLNPYYQQLHNQDIKTKIEFYSILQWYLENLNPSPVMSANDVDKERHRLKYALINCGFEYPDIEDMLDIYETYIEYQLEFLKPLADLALNKQYYKIKEDLTI
jgi:hypothetical protein